MATAQGGLQGYPPRERRPATAVVVARPILEGSCHAYPAQMVAPETPNQVVVPVRACARIGHRAAPSRQQRRQRFSQQQVDELIRHVELHGNCTPTHEQKDMLVRRLGLRRKQIEDWMKNYKRRHSGAGKDKKVEEQQLSELAKDFSYWNECEALPEMDLIQRTMPISDMPAWPPARGARKGERRGGRGGWPAGA